MRCIIAITAISLLLAVVTFYADDCMIYMIYEIVANYTRSEKANQASD